MLRVHHPGVLGLAGARLLALAGGAVAGGEVHFARPRKALAVERNVGTTQQDCPGALAGVLDHLRRDAQLPSEDPLQRGCVLCVEGRRAVRCRPPALSRRWEYR